MSIGLEKQAMLRQIAVNLSDEEIEGAEQIAQREGVSRSRVLRVAVQRLLEEEQPTPGPAEKKRRKREQ